MNICINIESIKDKEFAAKLLATSFAGTPLAGTPETDENYSTGIMVKGETFTADPDELPQADERATDGEAVVKQYSIDGAEVFLLRTPYERSLLIADPGTTVEQIVADFDTGDLDLPQHLASWGFDGTPDAADDGATNVRVWIEPCYYSGTIGAPIGHYVRDDQSDPIVFPTTADAQAYIDEQESGVYVLSNGEAGRPDFTICL